MAEGIQAPPLYCQREERWELISGRADLRDTHDDETGSATSVATETASSQDEAARSSLYRCDGERPYSHDRVHDGLEEVNHDQADNAAHARDGTSQNNHDASHGAVNG